jgi:ABC-type phosphate transport system permease subunit
MKLDKDINGTVEQSIYTSLYMCIHHVFIGVCIYIYVCVYICICMYIYDNAHMKLDKNINDTIEQG